MHFLCPSNSTLEIYSKNIIQICKIIQILFIEPGATYRVTWGGIQNLDSWAPPHTFRSRISGNGTREPAFWNKQNTSVWKLPAKKLYVIKTTVPWEKGLKLKSFTFIVTKLFCQQSCQQKNFLIAHQFYYHKGWLNMTRQIWIAST